MEFYHKKTHTDQIWISEPRERAVVNSMKHLLVANGYMPGESDQARNFGIPWVFTQGNKTVTCRFIDSVFLDDPDVAERAAVITDNIPLVPMPQLMLMVPEFWHIWHFQSEYIDRAPTKVFNCFMNRISGERSIVFYELIKRNLLDQGFISFNCFRPGNNMLPHDNTDYSQQNYDWQYTTAELTKYEKEHNLGRAIIPYNNLGEETLEQCVIDSKVSLVIETYTSNSHIVFSEKIFRALQLPRPWLLYCSPDSIKNLRDYGFDVLDDYVDHSYDQCPDHFPRLGMILTQLESFADKNYTDKDYARFKQAADTNSQLLLELADRWPQKLESVKNQITSL